MAQLDRFLNLLVTNNATALVLTEGEIATVMIKDSARPVMKQALTTPGPENAHGVGALCFDASLTSSRPILTVS